MALKISKTSEMRGFSERMRLYTEGLSDEWKEIIVPTNSGWYASNAGSGGVVSTPFFIEVYTGTSASSRGLAYAQVRGLNSGSLSRPNIDWTKRLELEFQMARLSSDSECVARIQLKQTSSEGQLADLGLGLQINNYSVYGESYGSSRGTVSLGTMTDDRTSHVKIVKTDGDVQFWVNGVLTGTLSGNYVPNIAGTDAGYLVISIINGLTGGVADYFSASHIKIRQEW